MRTVALLCLAAAVASARGDVDDVRKALESGSWTLARISLSGLEGTLVRRAHDAYSVARAASDRAFEMGDAGKDAEALIAALEGIAAGLASEHPESADALAARAEIRLLRGRAERAESHAEIVPEAGPAFREAAELFAQAYERAPDRPMHLARSALCRVEQAWADPLSEDAQALAEECAKRLEERHAGMPAARLARGALALEAARRDLPEAKTTAEKRAVRDAFAAALLALGEAAAAQGADRELSTVYNEMVAFAAANAKELRIDANFLWDEWTAGLLVMRVPRTRLIRPDRRGGSQIYAQIEQWARDGRSSRLFLLTKYEWHVEYTTGPRGVGGDNPKGLIEGDYEDAVEGFRRITRNSRVRKGRLNRHIGVGYSFDVRGEDDYGRPLGYRGYCFKCEEHTATLQVWIREVGMGDDEPLGAFIIDSVREREPRK